MLHSRKPYILERMTPKAHRRKVYTSGEEEVTFSMRSKQS